MPPSTLPPQSRLLWQPPVSVEPFAGSCFTSLLPAAGDGRVLLYSCTCVAAYLNDTATRSPSKPVTHSSRSSASDQPCGHAEGCTVLEMIGKRTRHPALCAKKAHGRTPETQRRMIGSYVTAAETRERDRAGQGVSSITEQSFLASLLSDPSRFSVFQASGSPTRTSAQVQNLTFQCSFLPGTASSCRRGSSSTSSCLFYDSFYFLLFS